MPKKISPYILILLVSAIWGVSTPIVKYSLFFVTPVVFLTLRFLIASIILFFLLSTQKDALNLRVLGLKRFMYLFVFGLINGAVPLLFYFYGVSLATSVETSIMITMGPIAAVIMGFIFFHEQVTKKESIGIFIMLVGFFTAILFPILLEGGKQEEINLLGTLFLLFYLISNVFALLVIKHIMTDKRKIYSALQLAFFTSFSSLIVLFPFGLTEILTVPNLNFQPALFGIFYMAILSSVLAYYIYNLVIRQLGVGETTLFSYIEPLFGVPLAIIFLGESFSAFYVLGGILIVIGLLISEHISITRRRVWARK